MTSIGHCIRCHKELEVYIEKYHPGGSIAEGSVYVDSKTKMAFIDAAGNLFEMTPSDVKSGRWSSYESGNVRDPAFHMEELQKIVESRGGSIAEGSVYVDNRTKMAFIDAAGNRFEATPANVKSGRWSRYEHHHEGAKTTLSADNKTKTIVTKAGDKVVYSMEDGNPRIKAHVSRDGLTKRGWHWDVDPPVIMTVHRESKDYIYELVRVETLDGEQLPLENYLKNKAPGNDDDPEPQSMAI